VGPMIYINKYGMLKIIDEKDTDTIPEEIYEMIENREKIV
jgi:hypothetical protein